MRLFLVTCAAIVTLQVIVGAYIVRLLWRPDPPNRFDGIPDACDPHANCKHWGEHPFCNLDVK